MKHVVFLRCTGGHVTGIFETSVDTDTGVISDWLRRARVRHRMAFSECTAAVEVIRGRVLTPEESLRELDAPPLVVDLPFQAKPQDKDIHCEFCGKAGVPDALHLQSQVRSRATVCDSCVDLLHDAVRAARRALGRH